MEPIVNVPIGDYDALRDRVKELEAENAQLKECNEHLCEKNKVVVIHEKPVTIFRDTAVGSIKRKRFIELKNLDDVKDEVVEALTKKVERLKNRGWWERLRNK